MADQILSLSFRPQSFDQLVGARRVTDVIRANISGGRTVPAWMFAGDTGCGKTTIARILAVSLQCVHQGAFGSPCAECYAKKNQFDIVEINAGDISGVNEIQQVIQGSNYMPRQPSLKRVYILDEAQRLSTAAQQSLLKPFEDAPASTVWIICTTEPGKILKTLRGRCLTFTLPGLGLKGVENLVTRALNFAKSGMQAGPLVDALQERNVTSPRMVVMAVEKYVAGETPERAAEVGLEATVNTLRICRAVVKGDWESVRTEASHATPSDAIAIRAAVAGYLKSVLGGQSAGKSASKAADAILLLSRITFDDTFQLPATLAALYQVCKSYRLP